MEGISGRLLSQAFLENHLQTLGGGPPLSGWPHVFAGFGPATPLRALLFAGATPFLCSFGFDPPVEVQEGPGIIAATVVAEGHRVALVVASFGQPLDQLWRVSVTEALRRAATWCLVFNGSNLRLIDVARAYARRHVEFDLEIAAQDPATGAVLSTVLSCVVGRMASLGALIASSDAFAAAVSRSLREGVLVASQDLLEALVARPRASRTRSLDDEFGQALTIVYRLLFLLFAEARSIVPVWHPVYRNAYSVESLRSEAGRGRQARGIWDALRAMSRLAHAGCRAGNLRVTPFNGRLFAPSCTPLAERANLDERKASHAVLALSTRRSPGGGHEPIRYRDLGVEHLGAVYETLLDYQPSMDRSGRVTLQPESGLRKATGTFYTPQPIADYLVRRTLAPLVAGRTAETILRLRIVDPSMGSGAFLIAACRYLAAAYEAALLDAGACHAIDISEGDRSAFRRLVAERCLYGVDLNPMAVQLARLSMWLATLAVDRPLSFLDHRLRAGDSVLGAWIAQLRQPPRATPRSRALPLFDIDAAVDALRAALPVRFSLESTPNDTLAQVRAKERAFAAASDRDAALTRWKRVADVWCATWFSTPAQPVPAQLFRDLADAILTGRGSLPPPTAKPYLEASESIANRSRFFHWELEFPEVFFEADGARLANAGFDAVIGNPPWDMIRADSPTPPSPGAHGDIRVAAVLRFTRDAGSYTAQGDGHANRYQLFLERAMGLTRAGGRIGLVLPWGLAADHGSAALRRALLTRCDVDALTAFDNRRAVFPIHRSVRFLLATATAGTPTHSIACRFGLEDPASLESAGDEPPHRSSWYSVRLSPELLTRISGPALTIPHCTSPVDVAIVERAASLFAPLGSADGWAVRFGRELNATEDRRAFGARGQGLPVIDGKHLNPFRVDVGATARSISDADASRLLRSERYRQPRLAYRDVAGATNRVTLIAAVLPPACVSTHTLFVLRTPLPSTAQQFLCGLFNSFVVNYLVRLRITTHVTTATVERLPIPPMTAAPSAALEIADLARRLGQRDDRNAVACLNALVARVYQVTIREFEHILDTFPLVDRSVRNDALWSMASQL